MDIIYTDNGFGNTDIERDIIEPAGGKLIAKQCRTEDEVVAVARTADAVLVQWAPISTRVIEQLEHCRLIVRIGIGVDNVDLAAARKRGIDVCNVPDYCTDEVADHTLALALAMVRQVTRTDARTRRGEWKITPDHPITALSEQTFVTVGFGRIARAVLKRAEAFGFKLAAVDPLVSDEDFADASVKRLTLDEALRKADVLSLHCGLNDETYHLIDEGTLGRMKSSAVLVNTSRGGLVNAAALASALESGKIAGAGLDVYETEPLPTGSPLRNSPNTLLTSHIAWYSTNSIIRLRELAAKEIARFIKGDPLLHVVN
ncbi:MAG: C-terminal binding protein [Rhodothermales bacterium]